ncbi:MAG: substrate-binding domain-containing protein, partial [Chloroflexi bacterium]
MPIKNRASLSLLAGIALIASACGGPAAAPSPTTATQAAATPTQAAATATAGGVAKAVPGQSVKMMLLPKFLGILPFAQANKGAGDAAAELKNSTALAFVGPTADNSVQGQIEFVTNAATQGYKVVMISNNAGDQIAPAAAAAQA